jgi:CRP/FNR family transcriptional regulator, cyclic AMP receptor protein
VGIREVADQLASVPLFAGCSKRELQTIARAAKEVSHPAGKVLAAEGEKGVGFFLILEGTAKVTVGGRTRNTLGPSEFFGEISLLDQGPRSATVIATSPVKLLGITAWVFQGLVQEHPAIALKMLEVVAGRLRSATKAATA